MTKVLSEVRRRPRVQTVNNEPSMTVQSEVERSEMRHILAKYEQTGVLVGMRDVDLTFRDVSEFEDYVDVMREGKTAEAAFMQLPAKVREVFGNDVFTWLDAAHDPEKLEALRPQLTRLGVLEALDVPPVAPPAAATEPPAPPPPAE